MKLLCVILLAVAAFGANAQFVQTNPLEWLALAEGNDAINGQIENEVKGQTETALLQTTIAGEFVKIKEWKGKYSSYLKTAEGYASSLKAATSLYEDGVRIFITLGKLRRAIKDNPQDIAATMSMNNLYIETATELVTVYTLLRNAIATGGETNMLTGAERSKTMWQLTDRLDNFNKKLNRLYLSIRYYTMADVWNSFTAGMLTRNTSTIATTSFTRWHRAAKSVR
jgi:hypothetical protein